MTNAVIPLMTDEEAPKEVREFFEKVSETIGFVPNLFRLWARAPHLLDPLIAFETAVSGSGKISMHLKGLAMLRTSELNGCPYCAAVHGAKFESIGGATEQAAALKQRQLPQGLFSEEELTVLQLTDEMTLMVRGQPETVGKAIALFGVDGAVELMAVIALLNFDNRMAFTAELPVDRR